MNREIETVGWAILQALHDGIEDGPQSWSDLADDQEKRIIRAAIAAIEAVTDLSQYKAQGFSLHRPVAFRVPRADPSTAGEMYGTEWRLFGDEEAAREAAYDLGVEYQGLYVRDGSTVTSQDGKSP
jgi:hypothetical protein